MDSLMCTREEFRQGMNKLLEFLAQALGGVPGTFTAEDIDPLKAILQGEPSLLAAAQPPANDDSLRLPSTSWIQALLLAQAGRIIGGGHSGPSAGSLVFQLAGVNGKKIGLQWGGASPPSPAAIAVTFATPYITAPPAVMLGPVNSNNPADIQPIGLAGLYGVPQLDKFYASYAKIGPGQALVYGPVVFYWFAIGEVA
jgi:hypothetical protein